ncbi:DNA-methyltransferase [Thermocaproicibacter melissae]|jgi:DNA modification methylase|uniref:DNA-methyltransferase n=1 Tax=Thermocaproicibacter melissae TaxID=2966552 RepID=UPI003A0FC8F4
MIVYLAFLKIHYILTANTYKERTVVVNTLPILKTNKGMVFNGDSLELIPQLEDESIDLVMTSPPFALQRQKEYGNKQQNEYVEWLAEFAQKLLPKLKDTGSFVLDLGGAYQKGKPVRSLYNYKVLIKFCEDLGYNLAEEFFWYNPAKLPSPIEWVNKRKIRVKDAVNTVWWFSKTAFPKADVTKVLVPYSDRMKKLIKDAEKFYTPKERPSGHDISASFAKNNGGAIPSNLLQIPNTESTSSYLKLCKELGIKAHPARFPAKLPEFFIKMLTDPDDVVLDIFAGSNTTGYVAESLGRRWISFEESLEYIANSSLRFASNASEAKEYYESILSGNSITVTAPIQFNLFQ